MIDLNLVRELLEEIEIGVGRRIIDRLHGRIRNLGQARFADLSPDLIGMVIDRSAMEHEQLAQVAWLVANAMTLRNSLEGPAREAADTIISKSILQAIKTTKTDQSETESSQGEDEEGQKDDGEDESSEGDEEAEPESETRQTAACRATASIQVETACQCGFCRRQRKNSFKSSRPTKISA